MSLLKPFLPLITLSANHLCVSFPLLCVLFNTERERGAAFTWDWRRSLPGSAEPRQHHKPHKPNKDSCPLSPASSRLPLAQWPLVSVMLPTHCVPFTLSQQPVMGKCTGIMYRMLCAVQELILHTTSLIPIEKAVIPHLQSQISPQSSLLFCHYYSPV